MIFSFDKHNINEEMRYYNNALSKNEITDLGNRWLMLRDEPK